MARLRDSLTLRSSGKTCLGGVLFFLIATMVIFALSETRLRREYVLDASISEPDAALAKEGEQLTRSRGCADCHGDDLAGKLIADEMPFARLVGSSLRRDTDHRTMHEQIYRALHHGIDMESRPLLMMPSASYNSLSRREIEAIAAYLSTLPPAEHRLPESALGPLGRVLLIAGQLDGFLSAEKIDHGAAPSDAPPPVGTIAYGRHAAQLCKGCHQPDFGGGPMAHGPSLPPASNLTPHPSGLLHWSEDDFVSAMRTGRRPDGTQLNGDAMPWRAVGQASDAELRSIWSYLRTIRPVQRETRAMR